MPSDHTTKGSTRQWLLLIGLLAVLVGVLVFRGRAQTNLSPAQSNSMQRRASPSQQGRAGISPGDLDVRLGDLSANKQEPQDSERNPFRFQERRAEPSAPGGAVRPSPPVEPPPPPGPPPVPPIALKFIGVVESAEAGKVAALTDGRNVFHGREGDIIEGRYRIVKIGLESIVVEHADGRGRQTIRLSGS